jgi:hypothetical protein
MPSTVVVILWLMPDSLLAPDLPVGWTCRIDLNSTPEGTYSGKAELRFEGEQRCVLVIAQQPSREAALHRVKIRAEFFVSEWTSRSHTGHTGFSELDI